MAAADYGTVPGPIFADLLDAALDSHVRPGSTIGSGSAVVSGQPSNPFLFFSIPAAVRPGAGYPAARSVSGHTVSAAVEPACGPSFRVECARTIRTLTSAQNRAVALLASLGASLPTGFSLRDLRREYRALARRIHPDRHPDASTDERRRLSRLFADAHDSYRCLAEIAAPTR